MGARRGVDRRSRNYRRAPTRPRCGRHVIDCRFARNLRKAPAPDSGLLQRYFQPSERFYIVFSERSQTCYNFHQGEQQLGIDGEG